MPIDPAALDPDPMTELAAWVAQAEAAGHRLATAFSLATADAEGRPTVRLVLARGIDADGVRFYTNRASVKGHDLAANPRAAAAFWWERINRQVRVSGAVEALAEASSSAYWAARPRGSQVAAWASDQSQPIADRAALEARVAEMEARFGNDPVPIPPDWGGYRIIPDVVEFWESREDRLHDRIEFRRSGEAGWTRRRLQP